MLRQDVHNNLWVFFVDNCQIFFWSICTPSKAENNILFLFQLSFVHTESVVTDSAQNNTNQAFERCWIEPAIINGCTPVDCDQIHLFHAAPGRDYAAVSVSS